MLFVGFGYLLGEAGAGPLDIRVDSKLLHTFAEFTLVLVLFSDAASVRLSSLRRHAATPARMLLVGMPLTIALGTAVVHWLLPEVPLVLALLVAAILTPTDAALAQPILASPKVPEHVREGINVESGLNDGLAAPVIMMSAILAAQATGTYINDAPESLFQFVALQFIVGPLIGGGIGYILARLLDRCIINGYVSPPSRGIAVLAGALLCFTAAEQLGGNGFLAAFVGGLTLGNTLTSERDFIVEFVEGEGQILTILTFIIFGAILLPIGLSHISWQTILLALSFLTAVRMLPIWLSLIGTGMPTAHKLALGWFGPRGLASILFVLVIDEQFNLPGFEQLISVVVLTVLMSIVLHGASAQPIANWLGRRSNSR